MRHLLIAALCLLACGPSGVDPDVPPSAVVIMGERRSDESDPDVTPHVEQYPACMGVAIDARTVLTSDHCEAGLIDGAWVVVTARQWEHTANGNVLADTLSVEGEVRRLRTRAPVTDWTTIAAATDGPARFPAVRDTQIVMIDTVLTGDQMSGSVGDIDHGESGSPLYQGPAVGLVQACHSTKGEGGPCDIPGGRFAAP